MHPIFEKVASLESAIKDLKAEFAAYVSNKSIPLDERWALFKKAPSSLTNTSRWSWDFKCVDVSWYHDYHVKRYETVNLVDFIEDHLAYEIETDDDAKKKWEPLIPLMKEEILADNTREFVYDW